jgi:hypothetical protein
MVIVPGILRCRVHSLINLRSPVDAGLGAIVEVDALYARLDDQCRSDRIVVTASGESFVPTEETTLNYTAVNVSVDRAGTCWPETHGWATRRNYKAFAAEFHQSLQMFPSNVR